MVSEETKIFVVVVVVCCCCFIFFDMFKLSSSVCTYSSFTCFTHVVCCCCSNLCQTLFFLSFFFPSALLLHLSFILFLSFSFFHSLSFILFLSFSFFHFLSFILFFTGVSYHFIKMYGHPVGWQIVYYIFTFLKGIMFFSVIMLVGTGWSLLKVSIVVVLFFAGCGFSFSSSLFLLLHLFFS